MGEDWVQSFQEWEDGRGMDAERWFDVTPFRNAYDYLVHASLNLLAVSDPMRWKWVAICLHSALYHFMISALEGANFHRVVDFTKMPRSLKRRLKTVEGVPDAFVRRLEIEEEHVHSGKSQLISFEEALKRVQNPHWMEILVYSGAVTLSEREIQEVRRLKNLYRNLFEHFMPMTRVLHTSEFVEPCIAVCAVIEKVLDRGAFQMTSGSWEGENERIHAASKTEIAKIMHRLTELATDSL